MAETLLKTKETAAGAQQYTAPDFKMAELVKRFHKDMRLVDDDKMTRAEFKKKFGVTVNKAQIMIYAAEAAQRVEETGGRSVRMKDYEKSLLRQNKKEKKMGLDRSVRGNGG